MIVLSWVGFVVVFAIVIWVAKAAIDDVIYSVACNSNWREFVAPVLVLIGLSIASIPIYHIAPFTIVFK